MAKTLWAANLAPLMEARQSELEAEGDKILIVPTSGAHPLGFAAHALTFKEMIEQSEGAGDRLDWIFHTAGTGTALPGLIAAKLMINHPVCFRSIAICAYDEGGWVSPSVIVSRVKLIMKRLGVDPPPDHRIGAEIDLDQRFAQVAHHVQAL